MRGAPPARNVDEVEALKREAGIAACSFVSSGMRLGLGTGSTVRYTVLEIGRRIAEETLEVIGVPTSEATRHLAEGLGIPLLSLEEAGELDLTIDSPALGRLRTARRAPSPSHRCRPQEAGQIPQGRVPACCHPPPRPWLWKPRPPSSPV